MQRELVLRNSSLSPFYEAHPHRRLSFSLSAVTHRRLIVCTYTVVEDTPPRPEYSHSLFSLLYLATLCHSLSSHLVHSSIHSGYSRMTAKFYLWTMRANRIKSIESSRPRSHNGTRASRRLRASKLILTYNILKLENKISMQKKIYTHITKSQCFYLISANQREEN